MHFRLREAWDWFNQCFGLSEKVNQLSDVRTRKNIPLATAVTMILTMFMTRCDSLRSFMQSPMYHMRQRLRNIAPGRLPRRDALEDMIHGLKVPELKALLLHVVQTLKDDGVLLKNSIDGVIVAALDGVETVLSHIKMFPDCLTRWHDNGTLDYYAKQVAVMIVGPMLNVFVGFTSLTPRDGLEKDEGELTGALRVVRELCEAAGKFADVIVADALYLKAPFIDLVRSFEMHVVIRLKEERRLLYQFALHDFNKGRHRAESFVHEGLRVLVNDHAYPMTNLKEKTIRVLRFLLVDMQTGEIMGEMWVAATSRDLTPETIFKIMKVRWNEENNGFNELKTQYHADHCYTGRAIEQMFALALLAYNLFETYMRLIHRIKERKLLRSKKLIARELFDSLIDTPLYGNTG